MEKGYKFYNHHRESEEMIWYKWTRTDVADRVPAYATSIEGGGAIVLSPDMKQALLVKERGMYMRAGGALDIGESTLETALRECEEETGVEIDPSFLPLLGAAYQQPMSRDGLINDNFFYFLVRAKSMNLRVDESEIQGAKWFNVDELVQKWRTFRGEWKANEDDSIQRGEEPVLPSYLQIGEDKIKCNELICLNRFVKGQARTVMRVRLSDRRKKPAILV
mmetsp:Transcript_22292/g.31167  ORF Transcript_22292/g.31167 Transcript_22292/m.31167 type:complete len:221 (-) Transcript_22292:175-837(-)